MTDKQLDRVEDKLDVMNAWLGDINVTLAKQETQLTYHIKRTDMLEARVETIQRYIYMGVGMGIVVGTVINVLIKLYL